MSSPLSLGVYTPGTNVILPDGVQPGQPLVFQSPQGPMTILAPPNAVAGMQLFVPMMTIEPPRPVVDFGGAVVGSKAHPLVDIRVELAQGSRVRLGERVAGRVCLTEAKYICHYANFHLLFLDNLCYRYW